MIITRTPFRISFAGGGSDLPAFYGREPGYVLSTSINKYVYIALHPFFDKKRTQIKYSKTELVEDIRRIEHPIVRQALIDHDLEGLDINSIADIPAGTGLGSSSSFTVSLLHALHTFRGEYVSHEQLAMKACELEIEKLGEPIGKQDQYAASFGGLNFITFNSDDSVNVEKIVMNKKVLSELQDSLLMFYTGGQRNTREILSEQRKNTEINSTKFNNLKKMTELAVDLKKALVSNNLEDFGRILHEGWLLKRELASGVTSEKIDYYYNKGIECGALGGKLLGAGGGGYLLFFCKKENQKRLRSEMSDLNELQFEFDSMGSQVVFVG